MAISRRKRSPLPEETVDRELLITDRRLLRLHQYWLLQRGARRMPARADIDPVKMRFVLGHLMLIDVLSPGPEFRVRLQGSELTWWIGRELTGTVLPLVPTTELEALARRKFLSVTQIRAPIGWIGSGLLDGFERHYQAVVLPLSSGGALVDVLIVAVRCGRSEADR
jgi:hypothetical protein